MFPLQESIISFARRADRSLGWPAMESKQAAALGRALANSPTIGAASDTDLPHLPPELLPFPRPVRLRTSLARVMELVLAWILAIHLCYLALTGILITVYKNADPPATVLMAYRKWFSGWRLQTPRPLALKKIPRYVRTMLVSVEDGKFYEHHGIDFEAFERAREINKRLGKPLYGGSTLTMQVARTLFLVPVKSYFRKYLEVLAALELEAILPKSRILELYFGYAEWGKGIFGIEAAARKYYGRGVSDLSRDEAARLIALLSSPIRYNPSTLGKNGILIERYQYLFSGFVEPAKAVEPPPPSPEPGADADAAAPIGAVNNAVDGAVNGAANGAVPAP
jgi:monofunctional biosynthetic peptidoglycan transglycosylase